MRRNNEHYQAIENYVNNTLKQVSQDYDERGEFPHALWTELCQTHGIFHSIAELNGMQFDTVFLELIRLIATQYPALAAIVLTQGYYGIAPIHLFGSKQQQEKYLKKLISGDSIAGLGYSELGRSGIDGMETTALQTETGWVLNGKKSSISNAKEADVFLILSKVCLLDGTQDIGFFIIDRHLNGVEVAGEIEKEGLNSLSLAPVIFNNVHLEDTALLGGVLNGKVQLDYLVSHMQLGLSSISIGIAQGAFDRGLEFVKIKRGFGKRLIDVDYHQYLFANLYNKVCSAETYFNSINSQEVIGHLFISRIKLYTTEVAIDLTDEIQRLIGPIQKAELQSIQRFITDAQLIENYGESGNSIRKKIAKSWVEEE